MIDKITTYDEYLASDAYWGREEAGNPGSEYGRTG